MKSRSQVFCLLLRAFSVSLITLTQEKKKKKYIANWARTGFNKKPLYYRTHYKHGKTHTLVIKYGIKQYFRS